MSPKLLSPFLVALVGLGGYGCAADDGMDEESTLDQEVTAAPTNLVATVISPQRISLSWDAIAGSATYVVLRGATPSSERTFTSTSPAGATTFLDTGLTPNTQYCYQIKAVLGGTASGPSNEQCVFTAPGPQPPTGVQAVTTSTTAINVSWSAVGGAVRYYVFESVGGGAFTQLGSVAAPTLSFAAEGLTPGTTYSFAIKTYIPNNLFSALSDPATASTFAAGLEAYYRFDEKTGTTAIDASPFQRTGTLSGGAALVTTDRAPLKDDTGHNPSSVSLATSTANVSATGTLPFGGNGDASISLWVKLTAAPTGPVTIIGRRSAGCGALMWELVQDATQLSFTGTTSLSFGRSLVVGSWTQVGVAQHGNVLQLYINGVQVGTGTFTPGAATTGAPLQIGDVGGCGTGGSLLVDEVKLFSTRLNAPDMAALGTLPPAPTGLVATEIHSNRVSLSWTAVPNAEQYFVYRGTQSGDEVFFTSNPSTTFLGDHLTANQTTSWQVQAVRGGLLSGMSNELLVTTSSALAAPTGLTATLNACCSPQRVDLAWSPVTGAIRYYVFQSTSGGAFVQIGSVAPATTAFTVGGLSAGTTYAFQVEAQDDGFTFSAPSAPATVTIPTP